MEKRIKQEGQFWAMRGATTMGILKMALDLVKRFKNDEQPQPQPQKINFDYAAKIEPVEGIELLAQAAKTSMISTTEALAAINKLATAQAQERPWYEGLKHFEIKLTNNGVVMEVQPAGWIHVTKKWIEAREEALKYARHTRSREQIKKRIANGERVLNIMIEQRIGAAEAFKILRGQH